MNVRSQTPGLAIPALSEEERLAERRFRLALIALSVVVALLLLRRGFFVHTDSRSYIDHLVYRTAGYPLFLDLTELLFGRFGLHAAFLLQILLGVWACQSLAATLRRALRVPRIGSVAALLVLLAPYVGPPYVANRILSEGLAYPLFLLTMRALLLVVTAARPSAIGGYVIFGTLVILVRPQFAFLHALSALTVAILWRSTGARRKACALALGWLLASGAATLTDRTIRWARHGYFGSAPFLAIQFMAPALYVSRPEDLARLEPAQASLVKGLRERAESQHLLISSNSRGSLNRFARHYEESYDRLAWRIAFATFQERTRSPGDAVTPFVASEAALLPIVPRLLWARRGTYLHLVLANIAGYHGYLYFALICLSYPALAGRRPRRGSSRLFFALVTTAHLANVVAVAVIEPLRMRYAFHTEALWVALVLALLGTTGHAAAAEESRKR